MALRLLCLRLPLLAARCKTLRARLRRWRLRTLDLRLFALAIVAALCAARGLWLFRSGSRRPTLLAARCKSLRARLLRRRFRTLALLLFALLIVTALRAIGQLRLLRTPILERRLTRGRSAEALGARRA